MESLFELIFSNPIFALLIIGGIISFFNRLLGGQQQQETEPREQNKSSTSQERNTARPTSVHHNRDKLGEAAHTTFDDQRERQMEQLAGRMNTALNIEKEMKDYPKVSSSLTALKTESVPHSKAQLKMKKRIQGKITQQGLVDSIIMAEVLGPPRSLAPYENVLMKRK